jgi:hypothetical protein
MKEELHEFKDSHAYTYSIKPWQNQIKENWEHGS